jgi:hypothetical protein
VAQVGTILSDCYEIKKKKDNMDAICDFKMQLVLIYVFVCFWDSLRLLGHSWRDWAAAAAFGGTRDETPV